VREWPEIEEMLRRCEVKWEYLTIGFFDQDDPNLWQQRLDQFGEDGWELASITPRSDRKLFWIIFKRPLESKEAT
jgi:hypothetical protein